MNVQLLIAQERKRRDMAVEKVQLGARREIKRIERYFKQKVAAIKQGSWRVQTFNQNIQVSLPIRKLVAQQYNCSEIDLLPNPKGRRDKFSIGRMIYVYFVFHTVGEKKYLKTSQATGVDRTTIYHAVQAVENYIDKPKMYQNEIRIYRNALRELGKLFPDCSLL